MEQNSTKYDDLKLQALENSSIFGTKKPLINKEREEEKKKTIISNLTTNIM